MLAFLPSRKPCWRYRDVTPPERHDRVNSPALSSQAPNPARYLWAPNTCCTTLFSSASPKTLPHLEWFKQWVRKGRRRCKTLIFVTNDYLQNTVLLQPRLTSKYIQHTVMLPSWLNRELEVKLTGNTSNSFLLAPTSFRKVITVQKGQWLLKPRKKGKKTHKTPMYNHNAQTFRGISNSKNETMKENNSSAKVDQRLNQSSKSDSPKTRRMT